MRGFLSCCLLFYVVGPSAVIAISMMGVMALNKIGAAENGVHRPRPVSTPGQFRDSPGQISRFFSVKLLILLALPRGFEPLFSP